MSTKQQRLAELAKQSPPMGFTSLAYLMDIDWLHEAFRRTRKDGAAGVDGQTGADYEKDLGANLQSLLDRAKSQEAKSGHAVEVLTSEPARPDHSSIASQLAANDIPCRPAKRTGLSVRLSHEVDWDLLRAAPPAVRENAFYLTAALLQDWPDVLHCWGRSAKLAGAIAGFTAGVPRIHVHFDKDHQFEGRDQDDSGLSAWYAIFSHSKRVRFLVDGRGASVAWKSWIQAFKGLDHLGLDDGAASE